LCCCSIISLFFVHCKKDPAAKTATQDGVGLVSSCGEPLTGSTVLDLIRDPDDVANDRMNLILYHYASALRTVLQDPALRCFVEEAAIASDNQGGVSMVALAQQNPAFLQAINNALRLSIAGHDWYPKGVEPGIESLTADPSWDAAGYLQARMAYPPYAYQPTLYFVYPPEHCVAERLPVIAIAQDVDDCDDVAGWRGEETVVLGEKDVQNSADPVLFVGPGRSVYQAAPIAGVNQVVLPPSGDIQPAGPAGNGNAGGVVNERYDVDIDVDLFQIKAGHRYESGPRSEISGVIEAFSLTSPNHVYTDFWEDFRKEQRRVHRNDINNSATFNNDLNAFHIPGPIYDSGVSSLFFLTYEHDWWASKKDVVNPCFSSSNYTVSVRMKYSHEWYFYHCGFGSTLFPVNGSVQEFQNDKCRFVLKRTN
jgi:hypothetical protein